MQYFLFTQETYCLFNTEPQLEDDIEQTNISSIVIDLWKAKLANAENKLNYYQRKFLTCIYVTNINTLLMIRSIKVCKLAELIPVLGLSEYHIARLLTYSLLTDSVIILN